jgi:hypothetical protein
MNLTRVAAAALLSFILADCQGSPSSAPASVPAPSASASAAPSASASATPPTPSAAASAPTATAASVASEYRGTIGSGLPVVARLHHEGDHVAGTYFYEQRGADLILTGTVNAAHMTLDELADKTKTGSIEADVAADGTLTGTWKNANGDKTLPIRLTPLVPQPSPASAIVFKKTVHATKPVAGKKSKDDVCKTSLEYAEVFGLSPAATAKINAKLAPADEVKMPSPCDHAVTTSAAYQVAHNDNGILSARVTGAVADSQAAHPGGGMSTVNVFVDTGADIKLFGDVLKPKGEATLRAAVGPVVDAVAKHDKWEPDQKPLVMDALASSSSFVLENKGLRIFPDSLPPPMAALGADGFFVPYAKLPHPSGRVGALWGQ